MRIFKVISKINYWNFYFDQEKINAYMKATWEKHYYIKASSLVVHSLSGIKKKLRIYSFYFMNNELIEGRLLCKIDF